MPVIGICVYINSILYIFVFSPHTGLHIESSSASNDELHTKLFHWAKNFKYSFSVIQYSMEFYICKQSNYYYYYSNLFLVN